MLKSIARFSRPLGLVFTLSLLTILLLAFRVQRTYGDIWKELGISKVQGETNIRESFLYGYFQHYGVEKAKHLLSGNRGSVAKDLMGYAKELVSSEAFKKQYDEMRDEARPQPVAGKQRTKEEVRQERISNTEKMIRETEKTIKEFPDMAKTLQPVLDMLKETLKDFRNPQSKTIDMYYQGELLEQQDQLKKYEEELAEWEKQFPADPRHLVRERLKTFIGLARTVDFDAALKTSGGKMKFANPAYESKPHDWKQIYRAGREVIEPAIAFAEQWLKELK